MLVRWFCRGQTLLLVPYFHKVYCTFYTANLIGNLWLGKTSTCQIRSFSTCYRHPHGIPSFFLFFQQRLKYFWELHSPSEVSRDWFCLINLHRRTKICEGIVWKNFLARVPQTKLTVFEMQDTLSKDQMYLWKQVCDFPPMRESHFLLISNQLSFPSPNKQSE